MEFYPVHFFWHITTATLFLMGLYSLAIGIKSKLRVFYSYCIFSFFLFVYVQFQSFYYEPLFVIAKWNETLSTILHWFVQVIYNCAYAFFFIYLLNVDRYLPRFAKWLKRFVIGIFLLSFITAIVSIALEQGLLFVNYFHYVFTPLMSVLGIIILIQLWKIPGNLKVIFFFGGLSYMLFSLLALILSSLNEYTAESMSGIVPMVYFYIGVIIEQICFGFALAYFTDELRNKYFESQTRNLKLKIEHNKELNEKLDNQSQRLKKLSLLAKEKEVELVKSAYESKLNESRLSSLQSKMNPHFIFNALNSIKAYLIDNDKRKAIDYMNRFSKLVRKILESSRIERISLSEELDIIELYVEIENTRFDNQIKFDLNILSSPSVLNIDMPPLILQPFIENALWHGLAPSPKEKHLYLSVIEKKGVVQINIEDNGVGRQKSFLTNENSKIDKKSMGMQLTKERLKVFNHQFNTAYRFEIIDKNDEESGTLVKLYLEQP